MNKLICLIRVQFFAILSDMLSLGGKRKRRPKVLYSGILLFIILLGCVSFFYCYAIGMGLRMFGSLDILPSMMMAVTCFIVLITTIYKVKGTIFGFKDYDMIMSLPVKVNMVVASRLVFLYAMNILFVLIVMFPAIAAYGLLAKPPITFYLVSIILSLFLPLVPIIVASLIGTLIIVLSSRIRYSNVLNIILSLGVFLLIIILSIGGDKTGQALVDMGNTFTSQVNRIYPLARMYNTAVIHSDIKAILMFIAISVVAFAIYSLLVGKVFTKINTVAMVGRYRTNYKMGKLKQSTAFMALYRKELRRFFSSTVYTLNAGIGIVILTVAAIAFPFINLDKLMADPDAAMLLINGGASVLVCFCLATSCTTSSSISLEGRNLWIIKSIPVQPKVVLYAKLAVNLTIAAPAIIDAMVISLVLSPSLLNCILTVVITALFAIFVALFGLLNNILFSNFEWTNETVVVKQSVPTMISIFGGIFAAVLQIPIVILLKSGGLGHLMYALLLIIIDVILYKLLMGIGIKRFKYL